MRTLDAMNLRSCLLLALATSCLASVPGVDASGGLGTEFLESWQWRRADVRRGVGSEAITALAADREGEVLAVGGEGGVSLFRNGAWQERLSRVGLVTDLAFAQDGTLWVGTPRRLWRYSSAGQLQQQSPGQGEAARFIYRIATLGALTVVTTEAGAYVHGETRAWERLGTDLPRSSGGAVALRWLPRARSESPGIAEVWLVVGGQLWRTTLREGGPVPEAPSFASARVVTIPDVRVAGSSFADCFGSEGCGCVARLRAHVGLSHWGRNSLAGRAPCRGSGCQFPVARATQGACSGWVPREAYCVPIHWTDAGGVPHLR